MVLLDTNQKTLNSLDYATMGSNGIRHDAYACEYCLKSFNKDFKDLESLAKKHRDKCDLRLSPIENGIIKLPTSRLKLLPKEKIAIIHRLGDLSCIEHPRFRLTYFPDPFWSNLTIYVYIKDHRPVGLLNMGIEGIGTPEKKIYCIDFFILKPYQRQTLGKQLFDFMLRDLHIKPEEVYYQRPSEQLFDFLKTYYGLEGVMCWG